MNQNEFVTRLREAIAASGKTQVEVAKDAGMVPARITDYLKKRYSPKSDGLKALAKALNVSPQWLAGENVPREPAEKKESHSTMLRIPVLGEIAGGLPIEAMEDISDDNDPDTWEEIPVSWTSGGKEFFALRVSGDSMEPDIPNGTIAIIERCYDFKNGAVMAVYVNGYNATLKKVKLEPNGIVSLLPFNHQHEPKIFTPDEVTRLPVRPLGLLVETRKKWR